MACENAGDTKNDTPMIDFIKGQIHLGPKSIQIASDCGELDILAKEGLIERREDASGIHYFVEAVADRMRFGVFITLREKRIHSFVLHWLDNPVKGWEDVSEEAMRDEYRLLTNFVKKAVGCLAHVRSDGIRSWGYKWGQVEVSCNRRDFLVTMYMAPRDRVARRKGF